MPMIKKIKTLLGCDTSETLFHQLLEAQHLSLYQLAFAWTHNHHLSQDLVQEMMLKAIEKRKQLDDVAHLKPWLCKILHNLYMDTLRYEKKWNWADDQEIDQQIDSHYQNISSEAQYINNQQLNQLQIAMTKLSSEHRTIISLIDLQDLSYQQAAEVLDLPHGTVMSRLSRARKHLKQLIEQAEKKPAQNIVAFRRT